MDLATYCRDVCGAKCCRMRAADEGEVTCPRLSADNTCSVYDRRYAPGMPDLVVVGYFRSRAHKDLNGAAVQRPFWCGRVLQIHERGGLPADVAAGCAAVHPELLEDG